MKQLQSFITSKYILWFILAIPAILTTKNGITGETAYPMLMHTTGEFAGRFLAIALLVTPLTMLLPAGRFRL